MTRATRVVVASRVAARVAIAIAVLAVSPVALADTPPSVWDRARDPAADLSFRVHVEVQRRLATRPRLDILEGQTRAARAMLERAGAEKSPDVRLRFDLGEVLLRLLEYARAADVLKAALAEAPDHPMAEESWLYLAFACGHTGDHDCERRAYGEVLRRKTEEIARATPILNLAETEMHLGDLKAALEGYREAIRLAGRMPPNEMGPLAVWGLAVALDRSGDRLGAEREARFAQELERSLGMQKLLHSKDKVFFFPDYELHWYDGLGATARARETPKPRDAARLWAAAEASFGEYVRLADPAKDRWIEIAKARLATAKLERAKAETRARETRSHDPSDEETTF